MGETQSSPPVRPWMADHPSQFFLLERAVEDEYRPRMLKELQCRVDVLAESARASSPDCAGCGRQMVCQDIRPVSWWARFGRLRTRVARYRCPACHGGAGRCWISWVWNQGASAVPWPACWRFWPQWRRIRWQRVWRICFWEWRSAPWVSGGWRSVWDKRPPVTATP